MMHSNQIKRFGEIRPSDMIFSKRERFEQNMGTEMWNKYQILTKRILPLAFWKNPFDVRAVIQYDICVKRFF